MKRTSKTKYTLGEHNEVISVLKIFSVMLLAPILALVMLAWLVT